MQKVLKQIGIKSIATKNEIKIYGGKLKKDKRLIKVPNLGDHRICMSSTVLALITGIKTKIKNFETVNTSSPNFLNIIKLLGGNLKLKNNHKLIIAADGSAASGKTTGAKKISKKYGLKFLSSGLLYRYASYQLIK